MSQTENDIPTAVPQGQRNAEGLARVAAALRGLRYGSVTAVVQDGVVVQVERTEKIRLAGRDGRGGA